jgi:hypothetical protein
LQIKPIVFDKLAELGLDSRSSYKKPSLRLFYSSEPLSSEFQRLRKSMGYNALVIQERKIKFYWDSLNQITNYV